LAVANGKNRQRQKQYQSFRLRLHSGLRQSGGRFATAFDAGLKPRSTLEATATATATTTAKATANNGNDGLLHAVSDQSNVFACCL